MHSLKIDFLPNKIYPELRRKSVEVGNSLGYDLSILCGKTINFNSPAVIKGLGPCVGIKVFTDKSQFVAHSAPEIDTYNDAAKTTLSKKIYELSNESYKEGKTPTALIYGGIAYDSENPLSEDSCKLVDIYEEACLEEGIEPTIITGQYSNGLDTRIDSYTVKKHITMWGKLIEKIKLSPDATQAEIKKALEELFEYIKIPNGTVLNIVNTLPRKTESLLNKQV